MFFKFIDINGAVYLINLDRISFITIDESNHNHFLIILDIDLNINCEIIIDYEQFKKFENFILWKKIY